MPQASPPARGQSHVWLGQGRAGAPGMLWGGSCEGTGGWGTQPKEMSAASSQGWVSDGNCCVFVHPSLGKQCPAFVSGRVASSRAPHLSLTPFPSLVSASLQLQEAGNAQRSPFPLDRAQPWHLCPTVVPVTTWALLGTDRHLEGSCGPFAGSLAPPAPPNRGWFLLEQVLHRHQPPLLAVGRRRLLLCPREWLERKVTLLLSALLWEADSPIHWGAFPGAP